ncbi:MAG: DUF4864 domain-containing protein [Acidiferrobacterales bacterium]
MRGRNLPKFLLSVVVVGISWPLMSVQADGRERVGVPTQRAGEHARNMASLQPDPKYSPEQVVRIQIEALGKKDIPHTNAGIEIAFRFASPANKRITGPLERFTRMVSGPVYEPMLSYREAQYGEIQATEDQAVQAVVLTTADGKKVGYLFSLSKQKVGRYATCWMTDSVTRFEVQGGPNPLFMI